MIVSIVIYEGVIKEISICEIHDLPIFVSAQHNLHLTIARINTSP